MAFHELQPEPGTLHGSYSRDYKPILTIDSGDTVRYKTLESRWHIDPYIEGKKRRAFSPRDPQRDVGHALVGPIAIRGAKPGMTLAVRVDELQVGSWGWSVAGGVDDTIHRRLGLDKAPPTQISWELDAERGVGRNQFGHEVRLRPFMGQMGMPPNEPGIHSTRPPRYCGGNIDCKELGVGSTLYLPIPVEGGLFSTGDGHAVQADGEVSSVAIECPVERVDLHFTLLENVKLSMPRAHTPEGWITFGINENLHEASMLALEGMLDLMQQLHDLDKKTALALASVVVDFRITQLVNADVCGVHAVLPHDAFKEKKTEK